LSWRRGGREEREDTAARGRKKRDEGRCIITKSERQKGKGIANEVCPCLSHMRRETNWYCCC
jgi:hypothetical protein